MSQSPSAHARSQGPQVPAPGRLPRLLLLCQMLPYPPHGGASIRTYNVLRQLARSFDITALCFYRRTQHQTAQTVASSMAALRALVRVDAYPIPQEHRRWRLVWDHARSVASRKAFTNYVYDSSPFQQRLRGLIAGSHYDLIHLDSLDLARYLPVVRRAGPVVCAHHNVESALLRRRAAAERAPWTRWYIGHQARLVEDDERRWCDKVDLNIVVSPADRDVLLEINPFANVVIAPNGVDVDTFRPRDAREDGVVFVGGASWFPNRDGMEFFGRNVLPFLRRRLPKVSVRWVGRASSRDKESFAKRFDIAMTGYVDDVREYLAGAACFVVPLRVGGGTRLKILDAWAMGKAVVSTSVGCEGLAAEDGRNILIRDTPDSFADAVSAVLTDDALRSRLGAAARQTAERIYSWDVIGAAMIHEYREVLRRTSRREGAV